MATDSGQLLDQPVTGTRRTRGERLFLWGACAAVLVVLVGFAPTYYLKAFFADRALSPLVHVHGLIMTTWFATFFAQVWLVESGNVRVHRKLGIFGVSLAVLILVIGTTTAIVAAHNGASPGPPPLVFLAIPLGDMLVFGTLVALAVAYRKRGDFHKRYMLMASLGILTAAIARIPFLAPGGLPLFFGLTDLIVLGFVFTDTMGKRRLHPAFAVGLVVIIGSQVARFLIAGTPAWLEFAGWLAQ
ncbi:MAG TPA: hypothetical protein VFE23_11735 [Usitatibacter sp.]|jgi:FtsH-binding integral membrane protein|nr:hypothetical protein [Usitatibacter sp.]